MARTTEIVPARVKELQLPHPTPLDQHPAAVYLARLAPGSRRTMRAALNVIAGILTSDRLDAETLDWARLRYQHTAAVRTALAERYAPATANKMLAALRSVLKEAWRLGQISSFEDYQRAIDIGTITGQVLPRGRALSEDEIDALFYACQVDRTPAGARDAAAIAIAYGGALRRAELVGLDLEHFESETGDLTVRRGKGRRDRVVFIVGDGARRHLADWLTHRGPEPGPLLLPVNKAGRVMHSRTVEVRDKAGRVRRVEVPARLTGQAVLNLLKKRAEEAGVRPFTPHDLRRTAITRLLQARVDIVTVQGLAGHSSPVTTAKYDRRGDEAKRAAARLLKVPYRGGAA